MNPRPDWKILLTAAAGITTTCAMTAAAFALADACSARRETREAAFTANESARLATRLEKERRMDHEQNAREIALVNEKMTRAESETADTLVELKTARAEIASLRIEAAKNKIATDALVAKNAVELETLRHRSASDLDSLRQKAAADLANERYRASLELAKASNDSRAAESRAAAARAETDRANRRADIAESTPAPIIVNPAPIYIQNNDAPRQAPVVIVKPAPPQRPVLPGPKPPGFYPKDI